MTTLTDDDFVAAGGGPIIDGVPRPKDCDPRSKIGEDPPMKPTGSVSCWIEDVREGCDWAAARLWERYHEQLMSLARRRLGDTSRAVSDEEDVALIAFTSFLRRSQTGAYPDLNDRHQLWKLLVTITARKALNQLRGSNRQKRGGDLSCASEPVTRVQQKQDVELVNQGPEPDVVVMTAEWMDRLLAALEDPELKQIAIAKLNGCSNPEIAEAIQRSLPTVERRLRLIRDKWCTELDG